MRCYSHLSDDEREQIGLAKALGHSIGAIAQAIGRPKSTISRELSAISCGPYLPLHAAGAYQLRREALIERDRALPTFVVDRLAEGWTPEQISRWLREETNVICGPWVARRPMPLSIGQPKGPSSCGVISRAVTNAAGHADRDLRKIPSRIASPSTAGCLVRSTSTKVSDEEIQDIVIIANLTHRKWGFKIPFHAILKELGKDLQNRFA